LYVLNRYLNIFKRIKEYLVTLISIWRISDNWVIWQYWSRPQRLCMQLRWNSTTDLCGILSSNSWISASQCSRNCRVRYRRNKLFSAPVFNLLSRGGISLSVVKLWEVPLKYDSLQGIDRLWDSHTVLCNWDITGG
jgi:hypothetical protein